VRRGRTTLAILASLVLATSPAHAADPAGAKAFVAWIYAHYSPTLRNFDVLGSDMPKVLHSSLIALIKEDQKVGDDQSPDLDGDPLCDCRNPGGLAFTIESVTATEFGRASATIIRRGAVGERDGDVIVLDLAQTSDGWRVYDVRTGDTPSLRAFLIKSILDWKGQLP
jgi:hypothetical protein